MKLIKMLIICIGVTVFLSVAYVTIHANRHLPPDEINAEAFIRYVLFFPGITIIAYLLSGIKIAQTWNHIFEIVFLVLPALILIHFVVSVMNAHASTAYWYWQIGEIALTYLAWRLTGRRWIRHIS